VSFDFGEDSKSDQLLVFTSGLQSLYDLVTMLFYASDQVYRPLLKSDYVVISAVIKITHLFLSKIADKNI
jgi:hypothetical protein